LRGHSIKHYGIYATAANRSEEPAFRVICGDVWFVIDGANGAIRSKLDQSQRAYRWLFNALHRLDFTVLASHPALLTELIVSHCAAVSFSASPGSWRRILQRLPKVPARLAKFSRLIEEDLLCRKSQ
jgi:hypothetical protein